TPLEGSRRESLFAEVQAYVLTDPTVARVRLWSPDGTLLFSTDGADKPGEQSTDPTIATAVGGSVQSRLAAESLSPPPTVQGNRESTPLFQTCGSAWIERTRGPRRPRRRRSRSPRPSSRCPTVWRPSRASPRTSGSRSSR